MAGDFDISDKDHAEDTAPQQPNGERVVEAWNAAYCAGIDADKLPKYLDALVSAARAEGRREAVRECRGKVATMEGVVPIAHTDGTVSLDAPWANFPTWIVRRTDVLAALAAMEGKE